MLVERLEEAHDRGAQVALVGVFPQQLAQEIEHLPLENGGDLLLPQHLGRDLLL